MLYGIRFLGEAGANLIAKEGTAIDFHNLGGCKYGIDFENNVFTWGGDSLRVKARVQTVRMEEPPAVTGSKAIETSIS